VYCDDDWVKVYSNEDYTSYYKPLSSKIYRQDNIIEAVEKHEFTQKGKNYLLEKQINVDKLKYKDLQYSVILREYDYKNWKTRLTYVTDFSNSGKTIQNLECPNPIWVDIIPPDDIILKKLLILFKIKR